MSDIICEIIVELLIKGPGYLIVRIWHSNKEADPDGCLVTLIGLAFWGVIIGSGWALSQ